MKIVNIVCSGSFNQPVNFNALLSLGPKIFQYDPEMYHGAYLIVNSKKITIYTSGKYIFVGLKNISDIEKQFKSMKKLLKPFLDIECIEPPITQNIVITDRISESINFLEIVEKKSKFKIEYEPEQFPGMIFRNLQGTCLIFRNGKILITGVKSLNDAQLVKKDILEMIK